MSSTRRTLTPARYISTSASPTELSRRRQRSMIAVSNGIVRNFGTFNVTSPLCQYVSLVGSRPRILQRLRPFVSLGSA